MRTELARPGLQFLTKTQFNELFTIHGTTMIFLFIAPMGLGLANYFVPLQIGAPDMAFPRLNMLSYWMLLFGGLTIFSSFLAPGGAAQTGWTFYTPLSDKLGSPGPGADMWIMGIVLVSTSSIMTAVNLMATIFMLRAPGMTMWRLSLFTWNMIITSLMILVAFPPLTGALSLLFMANFLIGGTTGVLIASPPFDYQAQDTYFIVAHMHYVLGGGSLFAIFAALYYWFPKVTGYLMNQRLGRLVFALEFVGFNLT